MRKKAGQKLNALSRLTPYMDLWKRRILLNAFFISQFSCCPLVWMFHSRGKKSKINRIHERYLRIIYNDKIYTFYKFLEKDGSVSIHKRNLRFLACEIFKLKRDMAPELKQPRFCCTNSEISSQRLWKFKLLRSKNLGITPSWDKRSRAFFTIQS